MKIRMLGNSIRLRLTQSEVRQLDEQGSVSEKVIFANNVESQLIYQLRTSPDPSPNATFGSSNITIILPKEMVNNWSSTDEISLEHKIDNGTDNPLKILVEKDFKCLTERPDEDESDLFTNPLQNQNC